MSNETKVFTVLGMSCSHCERAVKDAVGALSGVGGVEVDLAGKKVTVKFDPALTGPEKIVEAIEDQGYDVEK